jgi:PPOX class probable F420-dependent enzyme
MANQRAQIVMSEVEVSDFLTQQRSSTVATVGKDGQVNLVAMWYAWRDGHIWIETKSKSQKVVNLRRDGRMSFLVEAGETYDQLRGVAIVERYNAPYTEELKPFVELMAKNRVVVRLDPDRVRSWDHRKLGLDPIELGGSTAAFL